MATIHGKFGFTDDDATQAAEELKTAMDGFGTNEEAIVGILVSYNNEQRKTLADTYEQSYGQPLIDDLKSELSGDLEECVVAMMMAPRHYDAKMLHDAICGAGTDEDTLIGVLCTRNNDEIEEIKEIYQTEYEVELKDDLQCDTAGNFARLLHSLATASRQEGDEDEDQATEDAQSLVDAGINQLGTDESTFNAVLCLRSPQQLRAVFRKYQEMTGHELEDDIDSEMSSDVKEGLKAIIKMNKNRYGYFAERLNKAMRGFGTDDSELIRLIISRCETDLSCVAEEYEKMYETSLFEDVKGECGGYYKKLLLSVILGRPVTDDD